MHIGHSHDLVPGNKRHLVVEDAINFLVNLFSGPLFGMMGRLDFLGISDIFSFIVVYFVSWTFICF